MKNQLIYSIKSDGRTIFDGLNGIPYDLDRQVIDKIADAIYEAIHRLDPNTESATPNAAQPEHDPNRLFKAGDKVRIVAWNGRISSHDGKVGTVFRDEDNNGFAELSYDDMEDRITVHACMLELLEAIETQQPFSVERLALNGSFSVNHRNEKQKLTPVLTVFFSTTYHNERLYTEAEAKELADALCQSLNNECKATRNS